jgi:hypothetical protein
MLSNINHEFILQLETAQEGDVVCSTAFSHRRDIKGFIRVLWCAKTQPSLSGGVECLHKRDILPKMQIKPILEFSSTYNEQCHFLSNKFRL